MKNFFIVSLLVKNGMLGGSIVIEPEGLVYRTGKVTVPTEYRHLVMAAKDIRSVTEERFCLLPTVTVGMQDGREYRFVLFNGRKQFWEALREIGVDA